MESKFKEGDFILNKDIFMRKLEGPMQVVYFEKEYAALRIIKEGQCWIAHLPTQFIEVHYDKIEDTDTEYSVLKLLYGL